MRNSRWATELPTTISDAVWLRGRSPLHTGLRRLDAAPLSNKATEQHISHVRAKVSGSANVPLRAVAQAIGALPLSVTRVLLLLKGRV